MVPLLDVRQGEQLQRFTFTQYHMGIDARIIAYAETEDKAQEACAAAFKRMAELDACMSDYRKDSELMRLCDKAGWPPVPVSKDLFVVLERAVEVSKLSFGAFDVSAGPVIGVWRTARRAAVLPEPAALTQALGLVGWQRIRLDKARQRVQLTAKGMRLDLGGIAKGYAADKAQEALKAKGVRSALVEMGGDIVMSDPPPGSKGWVVRSAILGKDVTLANCAFSTSGDTEQSTVINGRRYSHIVDPRTGIALTSRIQVAVTAPDGLTSDPLSTALSVLGSSDYSPLLAAFPGTTAATKVLPFER